MTNHIADVLVTNDASIFKVLEGNRDTTAQRVKKIRQSMIDNGYIHCPIIVNEKMEVIDGQGRLEAEKSLGLPIEYIVFDGLTIKDCIALNVYQTGWTLKDYVESFADRGNKSYEFLLHLITKYSDLNMGICISAITGKIDNRASEIKSGNFECTGEQYEKADELLDYTMKFIRPIKNFSKGKIDYICTAIMFAYQLDGVNRERLAEKFERYYGMDDIPMFNDMSGALKTLTMIYNRRNNKEKIYFEVEYDKYMSGKYSWYAKKWGTNK